MTKTAFIGMGVMGAPMARHLAAAGHDVTVYNRTASKAQEWVAAHGGRSAATPREAAEGADAVFACVGRDEDVRAVTLGEDGAFAAMEKDALFVDHSTVSAALARELDEHAQAAGFHFVDAPVSGGQAGAERGALSVMCGGSDAAMVLARPLMEAYAARIVHIGGAGAGQQCKMANQVAIAGILQGLAEAMALTQASGLDEAKVFEAISGGAASSWQMLNRWDTMAKGEFDFGFAVEWMRKDLALVLGEARASGVSLPVTALVDQFYAEVEGMGGARQDTSSLARRYEKRD